VKGSAGVGEFDVKMFVPPMHISGSINLDYSLFSQDPNSPTFDPGSFVNSGTVLATAAVNIASVPEPASGALFLAGCILLVPFGVRAACRKQVIAKQY
jgi:hypothetical protein